MLESCIKKNTERIVQLLKIMQNTTHFLHRLVCQSKVTEDLAIIRQIPKIRQVVEANIYRVKAALAANKLSSAFYIGSLQNRDVHGDVIPDQTYDEELEEEMLAIHAGDGSANNESAKFRRTDNDDDDETNSRSYEISEHGTVSDTGKRRRRQRSSS
jgi:Fanconi anaemia protein FancD2 nuclease